ncbi:MAG: hypothetical protein BGN83_22120 [Rhizobium sp. 63-7]|nr:MAG: hypothetical protein BGN83_22120 [Rhizobium sp. 63-7]
MNMFLKTLVLSVAVAATTLTAIVPASAGDRHWRRHHSDRDAVALGVAGLAAGALIGSALANQPRYVEEEPVYVEPEYVEPVPVYRSRRVYVEDSGYVEPSRELRPWSGAWRRYCSQRYRSFDPSTGTYVGYDGREHFCTAG